jgi:hypothetical protein
MERSISWRSYSHLDSPEIVLLLWNSKAHYCAHNSHILSQIQSMAATIKGTMRDLRLLPRCK